MATLNHLWLSFTLKYAEAVFLRGQNPNSKLVKDKSKIIYLKHLKPLNSSLMAWIIREVVFIKEIQSIVTSTCKLVTPIPGIIASESRVLWFAYRHHILVAYLFGGSGCPNQFFSPLLPLHGTTWLVHVAYAANELSALHFWELSW